MNDDLDVRGDKIAAFYCSCGTVVRGNGAKTSHRRKHFRLGDRHRYVSKADFRARQGTP
jgi:hypothetical protein